MFYDKLTKVINIWEEIKVSDETLKPIVNKWSKRRNDVTFLCYFVIKISHDQIEKTYDIATNLVEFDNKRIHLQRIIVGYLNKYKS